MNSILQDTSKFSKIETDPYKYILKLEDKHNRLVDHLFKSNIINEAQKFKLRATGSRPGIMFGSPKTHKPDLPLRPVLSTVDTYNYNMSKWLASLIGDLTTNEYTVRDSFAFAQEISEVDTSKYYMASFDITSLFTNIPVAETCSIILDQLYPSIDSTFRGLKRNDMSKILDNCTKNNLFMYNSQFYLQIDGALMGDAFHQLWLIYF